MVMTSPQANLIERLKQEQAQKELTEAQFAQRLGVSRALWFLIKRGERKPSLRLLSAVAREFPELQLLVFEYIAGNHEKEG